MISPLLIQCSKSDNINQEFDPVARECSRLPNENSFFVKFYSEQIELNSDRLTFIGASPAPLGNNCYEFTYGAYDFAVSDESSGLYKEVSVDELTSNEIQRIELDESDSKALELIRGCGTWNRRLRQFDDSSLIFKVLDPEGTIPKTLRLESSSVEYGTFAPKENDLASFFSEFGCLVSSDFPGTSDTDLFFQLTSEKGKAVFEPTTFLENRSILTQIQLISFEKSCENSPYTFWNEGICHEKQYVDYCKQVDIEAFSPIRETVRALNASFFDKTSESLEPEELCLSTQNKLSSGNIDLIIERLGNDGGVLSTMLEIDLMLLKPYAKNFKSIRIYNQPVRNQHIFADFENLESLRLQDTETHDLTPFLGLTKISELELTIGGITNLEGIEKLKSLTDLNLQDQAISDISHLSGLTNLERVNLKENLISDPSPISALINLKTLKIGFNPLVNISDLRSHLNLESVEIKGLNIFQNQFDYSSLGMLPSNLERLDISNNNLKDITSFSQQLAKIKDLAEIDVSKNQLTSLSPLLASGNLRTIIAENNRIRSVDDLKANTWCPISERPSLDDENPEDACYVQIEMRFNCMESQNITDMQNSAFDYGFFLNKPRSISNSCPSED